MDAAERLRLLFAENVRAAAERRELPVSRLADEAGLSRAQIFNVLAAKQAATLTTIAKLAEVLRVDPADLLAKPSKDKSR